MVATVVGSKSKTIRANEVQSLLQYGYAAYDGLIVYQPGDVVKSIPLYMGNTSEMNVGVQKNLGVLFPKGQKDKLSAALELPDSMEAPLTAGQQVGHIQVKFDGQPVYRSTLHSNSQYEEGPWYSQLLDTLKQMIF